MTKKPKRTTHREADPDEIEEQQFEEDEAMPEQQSEEPKTPQGEPKHPDPKGKMVSYAPGYGPGPDGNPVELDKKEPEGEK